MSVRLAPFEALRKAGFPVAHIVVQVKRHLDDLSRLKDETPHKAEAVAETQAYLAGLESTSDRGQPASGSDQVEGGPTAV